MSAIPKISPEQQSIITQIANFNSDIDKVEALIRDYVPTVIRKVETVYKITLSPSQVASIRYKFKHHCQLTITGIIVQKTMNLYVLALGRTSPIELKRVFTLRQGGFAATKEDVGFLDFTIALNAIGQHIKKIKLEDSVLKQLEDTAFKEKIFEQIVHSTYAKDDEKRPASPGRKKTLFEKLTGSN